jgi:hypothetical protein
MNQPLLSSSSPSLVLVAYQVTGLLQLCKYAIQPKSRVDSTIFLKNVHKNLCPYLKMVHISKKFDFLEVHILKIDQKVFSSLVV